jgi:hypothetical protein
MTPVETYQPGKDASRLRKRVQQLHEELRDRSATAGSVRFAAVLLPGIVAIEDRSHRARYAE